MGYICYMLPTTHEGEPETTIESRFIIQSLELRIHNLFVRPVNPGTSWSRPPCNAWTASWRPQKQRVTSCFREVWVTPPPGVSMVVFRIFLWVFLMFFCNLFPSLPYPYIFSADLQEKLWHFSFPSSDRGINLWQIPPYRGLLRSGSCTNFLTNHSIW